MDAPQFYIGQCIHHLKFDYRGVIIDVDAEYAGTDEWYNQVALSRPPRDRPWYHVLVHDGGHITYVAERHLEQDITGEPVEHPAVDSFFESFENGVYRLRQRQ